MKNPFAVSITILLALTLGGSILGYRLGTADKEKPGAEATVSAGQTSLGGSASTSGVNTASAPQEGGPKAAAPNPAGDASTGTGSSMGTGSTATATNGATMEGGTMGTAAGAESTSTGTAPADNAPAPANNQAGTPGNTNLNGTVSSNAADGSLAPSGPNANQQGGGQPGTSPAERGNTGSAGTANPGAAASTPAAAAGDATKGKAVFASASCAGCHGANGAGGGIGPALNAPDGPKSWTLDQFQTSLRAGQSPAGPLKAPMPQFSAAQVSDDDVANIYAYIKTLN
jgi:mono/diheme cytochrome c family protein